MREHHPLSGPRRGKVAAVLLLFMIALSAGGSATFLPWRKARHAVPDLPRAAVHRADLKTTVTAGGYIESTKSTIIECKLENLQFRSHGHEMNLSGSSVIVSIIPDGTPVKKGDVLCRLDSSEYEELVRDQSIKVEEARSARLQAQLDFEVAQMAVHEYEQGLKHEIDKDYRSQIALGESELTRAQGRVDWSTRMLEMGYVSLAQVATDKSELERRKVNLRLLKGDYDLFLRFEDPSTLRQLESQVESTRANLVYQEMRLKRHEDRLTHYKEQVDYCTIRAPHDGFVVYARQHENAPVIEEGVRVRQRQQLFVLPDMDEMEVELALHESVIDRIHEGQPARIHIEALPNHMVEGQVVSVSPVPMLNHWTISQDVKNYMGRVRLLSIPRGLLPGMSAQVEVVTGNHPDALVIPPEALSVEHGRDVCYVAGADRIERREITVGSSTRELLEVTEGLAEGEEVVLEPAAYLGRGETPAEPFEPADSPATEPALGQ